jgi:CO/xanthine dehydrogenase FAD-binding subunit
MATLSSLCQLTLHLCPCTVYWYTNEIDNEFNREPMTYLRPHLLEDALQWLATERPLVMAGCTDIYPTTQAPSLSGPLLDITALGDLRGITRMDGWRRFGAATTWDDVLQAELPASYRMLKQAAREIGAVQIQVSGTIGGNLCTASPAADSVPCLMALDAEVELASVSGRRRLPLSEFLTGPRRTALRPDELLVAIHVPSHAETGLSGFAKLGARRYLVISIAMVAARLTFEDGRITDAALSVGACAPVAQRHDRLESLLVGCRPAEIDQLASQAMQMISDALAPIDDVRASAGYRRQAAAEIAWRTIGSLCAEAA